MQEQNKVKLVWKTYWYIRLELITVLVVIKLFLFLPLPPPFMEC